MLLLLLLLYASYYVTSTQTLSLHCQTSSVNCNKRKRRAVKMNFMQRFVEISLLIEKLFGETYF